MKNKYKLLLRGDSFRSNRCQSTNNVLDDPTKQIDALKTIKKYVVDHWEKHNFTLTEIVVSTYPTKFDTLLSTELKNIFNVDTRTIHSEKGNSNRSTPIKSGLADIQTNVLVCRFDLAMRENLPCNDMEKILFPCWEATGKPSVSDHFFWIPLRYIERYKNFINRWGFCSHDSITGLREGTDVECGVFRDIVMSSNPWWSPGTETYKNKDDNPWTIYAPCAGKGV